MSLFLSELRTASANLKKKWTASAKVDSQRQVCASGRQWVLVGASGLKLSYYYIVCVLCVVSLNATSLVLHFKKKNLLSFFFVFFFYFSVIVAVLVMLMEARNRIVFSNI